jgi:predicted transcriptional regulator
MPKTKPLEVLVKRAALLPEAAQQELAEIMAEAMDEIEAGHGSLYRLDKNEREGIERGLDAMRRGRFASDDEMAAIFRKARTPRP